MIRSIFKFLGLAPTDEESKISKAIDKKQKRLAKHGGRIIVGDRGGIRDYFDTKEGKSAYEKEVKNRILNKNE